MGPLFHRCSHIPFLLFLASIHGSSSAQHGGAAISGELGSVVREDNTVSNADQGLSYFFDCLDELSEQQREEVVVVHIGDSHVQADWFSGTLRMELQQRWGNAGRGLVFPFRQARTNAPPDVSSSSNIAWSVSRITSSQNRLAPGISGYGLRTETPSFELRLKVVPNARGLDYAFDRVTLFTAKGPDSYDLWVGDRSLPGSRQIADRERVHQVLPGETLSTISKRYHTTVDQLKAWNKLERDLIYAGSELLIENSAEVDSLRHRMTSPGMYLDLSSDERVPYRSSLKLPAEVDHLTLSAGHDQRTQRYLTLYGLVLEKESEAGILYHAIGANGARADHYLHAALFWEQLAQLAPDLVILSLGTNETASRSFRGDRFADQIDQMVALIREAAPGTSVLLTTPPDALRDQSQINLSMEEASRSLVALAEDRGYSAWDFFGIMGGSGSMYTWQHHGLAQPDGIHLTKAGYELQGNLLNQALMEAYERYRAYSSR